MPTKRKAAKRPSSVLRHIPGVHGAFHRPAVTLAFQRHGFRLTNTGGGIMVYRRAGRDVTTHVMDNSGEGNVPSSMSAPVEVFVFNREGDVVRTAEFPSVTDYLRTVRTGPVRLKKLAPRKRTPARNPDETPYEVGVRVGRMNAETALESIDIGLMVLDEDDTRADVASQYARVASIEESRDGAVFYDEPEMRGGRYTWEEFESGVHKGIELAIDHDARQPKRNPTRRKALARRSRR